MSGTASASIVKGSGLGVNPATKRVIANTQIRHGRNIPFPVIAPIKFNATRKTGS